MQKLKNHIDHVIDTTDLVADDVITPAEDTSFAEIRDYVIYYITGYLCKQLRKHTKCSVCLQSILTTQEYSGVPEAQLTNLKTRGGLMHPSLYFFNMICRIEDAFSKFCEHFDVFEKIIDHIIENFDNFPCSQHGEDILAFSIKYYIHCRMKQFTRLHNREHKKECAQRRKTAKLFLH